MISKIVSISILLTICLATSAQKKNEYPTISPSDDLDTLHGIAIPDPFRVLENIEHPITMEWLSKQEDILKKYDRSLVLKQQLQEQARQVMRIRYKETEGFEWADDEEDDPEYTFSLWSAKANQVRDIYFKKRNLEGYTKLVDVSEFKKSKSDNVLVSSILMNDEESTVAISLSHSGSDWNEIFIFDLQTKKQLSDTILSSTGDFFWNSEGIYYVGYQGYHDEFSPRTHQTLNYHKLGTNQDEDLILFRNPDTTSVNPFSIYSFDEEEYVLNYRYERNGKATNVSSLLSSIEDPSNFFMENFLSLPTNIDYTLDPEILIGDSILMRADINSPNFKIVVCDKSKLNSIKEFIPEFQDKLVNMTMVGNKHLACFYSLDANNSIMIYDLKGTLVKRITFPIGNNVTNIVTDERGEYAYYIVKSFFRPNIYFRLNLSTWDSQRIADLTLPYDAELFETRYVHYPSKDGTLIPMYIICKKDLKLNGKNPVLLYGYGGYGITLGPNFKPENILWLLNGGVLAIPNIRGGGVEGSEWANAGRGINKQNTIDDFIAAGDFLVNNNYTNPKRLACMGSSHGGLVVGAAITQRPALFRAAIPMAGAFDMIRFSLYSSGASNLNLREFGDPNKQNEFHNLLKFSPYHHVNEGVKYPQTLLITGDSDNRVPPFHSYKFLAELQRKGDPESFMILKVIEGAGHTYRVTDDGYFEDLAFRLHFLFDQLDMNIRMW